MKLVFVLNQMYKAGGIERTIYHRLIELNKSYEIYLITLENGDNPFYYGDLEGVNHIDLNLSFERKEDNGLKLNLKNILKTIFFIIKMQFFLRKIKPEFTINVIGTHSFYLLSFLFFTGNLVLEHHASLHQSPPNRLKKYIMRRFDKHIFLTEEELKLASFIKYKIVIPNPIQNYAINSIEYFSKKNRIVAAGRIVHVKGFDRLIKIWSNIHKKFPEWTVEIYGEPDVNVLHQLNSLIVKNHVQDTFFIKPATSDILEILNNSKIYAMTSHFECFPMVLLEAMSVGSLVIAFDCPTGPRNIIDNNCGYLIENDNIELFSNFLEKAILEENKSRDLALNAYEKSENFSISNIIEKWENFFSKDS